MSACLSPAIGTIQGHSLPNTVIFPVLSSVFSWPLSLLWHKTAQQEVIIQGREQIPGNESLYRAGNRYLGMKMLGDNLTSFYRNAFCELRKNQNTTIYAKHNYLCYSRTTKGPRLRTSSYNFLAPA